MAALRILPQLAGGKSIKAIEAQPHVCRASGHIDARGRAQAKHALHRLSQAVAQRRAVECRNQPPQLGRIEARLDFDAKTTSEHNPKLPAPLVLRNQTDDFRPAPPTKPCTHSVYLHASTSTPIKSQLKNGVARRATNQLRKQDRIDSIADLDPTPVSENHSKPGILCPHIHSQPHIHC
jgi:hypothetical protein